MSKYVTYKNPEFEPGDDRYMYSIEHHTPPRALYKELYELRMWFPCFGYPILPLSGATTVSAGAIYAPYIPISMSIPLST